MFKVDEHPLKDRLAGVQFCFLSDSDILKLSVVEVNNPLTFDSLMNPVPQGLHDKRMGVSPFDRNASCPTCGLTSNFCPGHHGRIKMVAPIYNPFMIKDLYRLMKAKCFHCHNLRIPDHKIDVFLNSLKLIKAGEIIQSQKLRQHFASLAQELISTKDPELNKRVSLAMANIPGQDQKISPKKGNKGQQQEEEEAMRILIRRANIQREQFEHDIMELVSDIENNEKRSFNQGADKTSIMQKFQIELLKEIWSSVITTKCPICKMNSPAFRKDGYTKMFVKPLAGKAKITNDQKSRLSGKTSQIDESTAHHTNKQGVSVKDEEEDLEEEIENEDMLEDLEILQDEEFKEGSQQKYISPTEVLEHLNKLWQRQGYLLDLIYGKFESDSSDQPLQVSSLGVNMFFINNIVVPPNRFRPESEGGAGQGKGGDKAYLHTHSAMLLKILTANQALKDALLDQAKTLEQGEGVSGSKTQKQGKLGITTQRWIQLQEAVNCFMDSSMASKNADKEQSGVRQLLEKKEGMFRMKMMGKRVNYGGRSVISPDPYITTDQIGIPVFMARRLTFPESVSSFNAERLRQAVRNGTKIHPGANMVEDEETGQQIHLDSLTLQQREGIAKLLTVGRKVVYRHLRNNDPLLVNRQPTLHKPSIMAHICRVLPKEQTIRMHYANCNTYNADFDGDEMNIHLLQSYQAHAEAYNIMATHKQYCVPTSGKPIRGLIQDSVVSGVYLTSKDTFLSKEQYNQLVYIGLRELIETDKIGKIVSLPPTIFKPKPLWTGKQVISTLLKNIVNKEVEYKAKNLTGLNCQFKAKLSAKEWGPIGKEEGDVLFRDNEHLRGALDKSAFGASEYGLVHSFYEVYGSEKAGELLTSLARVFTVFLQTYGFTCGVDDLIVRNDYNKVRRQLIENGHKDGMKAAAEFCKLEGYQAQDINYSNRVIKQSAARFDKDFEKLTKMSLPKNPFKDKACIQKNDPLRQALELKMSTAGSDFEMHDQELDNIIQGQMNEVTSKVLKEIVPDGLLKRFPQNCLSAMVMSGAKGGVVNQTQISVLLGQQSLEGRRVPKMQNGKTLPCYLPYDPNPRSSGYIADRFLSGLRPQDFYFHCMAGREGLIDTAVKTSRSGYLQRCLIKQLESLIVNYDMTVRDNDGSIVQFIYGDDGIDVVHSKYLEKYDFLEQNFNSLITSGKDLISKVNQDKVAEHKKQARRVAKQMKKENPEMSSVEALQLSSDPLLSIFHPQKYFGAISERTSFGIDNFVKKSCQFLKLESQKDRLLSRKYKPIQPETFQKMYYMKYMRSLVHAGENVGTIAGQSIGEPSTQMTLNTFHLAGHGAGNMTLGIPRLKEILMTTPYNIKTPIMKVFFRKDRKIDLDKCQRFANKFQKLKMADIVSQIKVSQGISKNTSDLGYSRVYNVVVEFENVKALQKNLGIDKVKLAELFSDHFIPQLMNEIFKHFRKDAADRQGSTVVQAEVGEVTGQQKNKTSKQVARMRDSKVKTGGESNVEGEMEQDEEAEVKGLRKAKLIEEDDRGKGRRDNDEDDDVSDGMVEMMNELNLDIEGNLRLTKDVRGYEDSEDQGEQEQAGIEQDVSGSEEGKQKGVEKYKQPLRDAHSKYVQYLRSIDIEEGVARVSISFPLDFKKVLMLSLVDTTLSKVLVRSVPGIEKCTLIKPKKDGDEAYLMVQGLNFEAFYPHQEIVDVKRLETNHSYALMGKYGVEAMRANIMKEVQMVFGIYGIAVDSRHLSLISDFMTFNGDYRAFNRIGMEESSSPFLKMSYETTMKYLVNSSMAQETDNMSTPSSAIVMGQIPRVGTNMFDLIQKY